MRTTSGTAQLTRARFLKPNRRARARAAIANARARLGLALVTLLNAPVVFARRLGSGVAKRARAIAAAAVALVRRSGSAARLPVALALGIGSGAANLARGIRARAVVLAGGVRKGAALPSRGLRAGGVVTGGALSSALSRWGRFPGGAYASAGSWMRIWTTRGAAATDKAATAAAVPPPRPESAGRTRPRLAPAPRPSPAVRRKAPSNRRPDAPSMPTLKLHRLGRSVASATSRSARAAIPPAPAPAQAGAEATAMAATIPWLAIRTPKPEPAKETPETAGRRASWTPRGGLAALAMAMDERSPLRKRVGVFVGLVVVLVLLGCGSIGLVRIAFGGGSGGGPLGHNRLTEPLSEGPGSGMLSFAGLVPSPTPSATSPGVSPTPSHSSTPPPAQRPQPTPTPSPTPTAQQPPSATLSTLSASPTSLIADSAMSATVVITLKDTTGNPVRGDHVTLVSSRGAQDTIAPLSSGSDNADSTGVARFKVTSTRAGAATLTAKDTTVNPNVTLTQTAALTFIPGQTAAGSSTVVAGPGSLNADGAVASSVTVTVKDAFNNVISGHQVSLASSRGAADVVTVVNGTTNVNGVASFKVSSTTAGPATMTATDTTAGIALATAPTITFIQATNAANSMVVAEPPSVPPDGVTASVITVTIRDYQGNPIAGHLVSVSSSAGPQDSVTAVGATTDSNGKATFEAVSSTAGTSALSATDTTAGVNITQTATLTFA